MLAVGRAAATPSPLVGEGRGGGSCRGALKCHISRPPPPTPPRKGEGRRSWLCHDVIHRLQSFVWRERNQVTGVGGFRPAKCAIRLSIINWPMAVRVSTVA